jgi:hypothetical protein
MTNLQTARQAHPGSGIAPAAHWRRFWEWLARPTHYRAVTRFRSAIEGGDSTILTRLLHPEVGVVIEAGSPDHPTRRGVVGAYDAIPLLVHSMGRQNGMSIDVRSVNGQAGIILTVRDRTTATMAVDFTGSRITMVWIRLHPYELRHWNRV